MLWPRMFACEAEVLQNALAPWLVGAVEHVGSTAILGLSAKPILNMIAGVRSLPDASGAVTVLDGLGYRHAEHRPHEALWFYKQPGQRYDDRTHQLHLTEVGSSQWRERLALRDALRASPGLRGQYQTLKLELAQKTGDLAAFNTAKRPFIARVLLTEGIDLGGG